MAVKKKTSKKASSKKTSGKGVGASIKRTSKKLVDQVLVRIPPQVQQKIDHLIATLDASKETRVGDLSLLASKILIRAQEVSRQLRGQTAAAAGTKKRK